MAKADTVEDISKKAKERISDDLRSIANKGIKDINKGLNAINDVKNKIINTNNSDNTQETGNISLMTVSKETADKIAQALQYVSPQDIIEKVSVGIVKNKKEVFDQQYRCAVVSFYADYLRKFIG